MPEEGRLLLHVELWPFEYTSNIFFPPLFLTQSMYIESSLILIINRGLWIVFKGPAASESNVVLDGITPSTQLREESIGMRQVKYIQGCPEKNGMAYFLVLSSTSALSTLATKQQFWEKCDMSTKILFCRHKIVLFWKRKDTFKR